MRELSVEGWLHTELSLNQLNFYKHLTSAYCPLLHAPIGTWCLVLRLSRLLEEWVPEDGEGVI